MAEPRWLPITRWLLDHDTLPDLSIIDVPQVGAWFPHGHFAHVESHYRGVRIFGRGHDRARTVAVEKACAEVFERVAVLHAGLTNSNGVAAHRSFRLASASAKRELVERDAFLCHSFARAPFHEVTSDARIIRGTAFGATRRRLAARSIALRLGEMQTATRTAGMVCAAFGARHAPRFGVVFGLGYGSDLVAAVNHSVSEVISNLLPILLGARFSGLSPAQFAALSHADSTAHLRLALFHRQAARAASMFTDVPRKRGGIAAAAPFAVERLALPAAFAGCPAVVVHATNAGLQPLVMGVPDPANVHAARVAAYGAGMPDVEDDWPGYPPHLLG